jgi:uncharacterized protein
MSNSPDFLEEESNLETTETRSWAERNGFPGWIMGIGWAFGAFVAFQIFAGIFLVVLLFALGRVTLGDFSQDALFENLDLLFVSNSFGQIIFLGILTFVVVLLSTSKQGRATFLRLGSPQHIPKNLIFAFLIVLAAQPLIMVLSWLNLQFPFSASYLDFELAQMKIIEDYLRSDHVVLFTLFHVAMVPAFCEEVLFRGYVLRNFEKSMLPWTAIILSGLVFGIFHVRLTQLIPLAVLGMLLAWITWHTGSIWPAIAAHFSNNAAAVLFSTYFPDIAFNEAMQGSLPPWYFIVWSIILTGILLYFIYHTNSQTNRSDAYV